MSCGEIFLVHFPFTDGTTTKVRPALVVSSDEYNSGPDVIILPLTSRVDSSLPHQYVIDMNLRKFRCAGLRHSSAIKLTVPMTIEKTLLRRRLGHLAETELEEVREQLRAVFS